MNQHKFSFRVGLLLILVAVMSAVFLVQLYHVQVTEASDESGAPANSFTYYTRVTAARGEILDRNGNVLVGNRASFNLALVADVLVNSDDPNEYLRQLVVLCRERGLEYADHFPVTMEKPYEYTTDEYSSTWNGYFKDFLQARDWDSDISAPQLVKRMRERYDIPVDWSEEDARAVVSIRYEMALRYCTILPTYIFLEDVDSASLAAITDLNVPGLNVETSTVREYYTDRAPHILGYTGKMDRDEWAYYKDLDYEMDATVGKAGLERAFEEQLHGRDGLRKTVISADGTILEESYVTEPIAGNNVELSIDLNLQATAEDKLEEMILWLRENGLGSKKQGMDAEGGACVVMKVKTGEILASASYPDYDLKTFSENYNELLTAEYDPLINRVTQGLYPPGSIFKMVTTVAAIDSGVIDRYFQVEDKGIYMRFADVGYYPRCMLYTTAGASHGVINCMQALAVSCNYYFYEIGWLAGIDKIDATAKALGLGESTGVEIYEEIGHRANPEVKDKLYTGDYSVWYGGDVVSAAIGQSEHLYTPLQLCSYVCALANKGIRYQATFLRRVISADYQELMEEKQPTVMSTLDISDEAYAAYSEGMRMSVTEWNGTSHSVFSDYPIKVCAKTGTAEHGSGGSDNGSYVLYAPMDDPEIAIMIYVQKGAQGGNLGRIAKSILDVYFSASSAVDTVPFENRVD